MMIKINLQLFADSEKTEKPTPKKRREAREEGQVLQSKEINTVFMLFSCFLGLKIFGKFMVNELTKFMINIFNEIGNVETVLNQNNLSIGFLKIMSVFVAISIPILLVAFFSGLVINYLQVGFLFTTKTLKIKLNRLNPIEGFKRIFSKRALVELVKSILKVVLVGYMAYNYGYKQMTRIMGYPNMDSIQFFVNLADLIFSFAVRILGVLLLLSILDYFYQWWDYEKNLMMSKQEIKEEYKQTEGDPFIKSKIKEKQRKIAMSRMMQDVPKADVIITNPTHFAVALKYDKDKYGAPYLLAKGADLIAENIKKIGRENSIPIVENKPLARTIFDSIDVGDVIPEDLYEAVAEVLAYVYSLKDDF